MILAAFVIFFAVPILSNAYDNFVSNLPGG